MNGITRDGAGSGMGGEGYWEMAEEIHVVHQSFLGFRFLGDLLRMSSSDFCT